MIEFDEIFLRILSGQRALMIVGYVGSYSVCPGLLCRFSGMVKRQTLSNRLGDYDREIHYLHTCLSCASNAYVI